MSELIDFRIEARMLLDEVNHHFERSPNGAKIYSSPYMSGIVEESSLKERVHILKKKYVHYLHLSGNE